MEGFNIILVASYLVLCFNPTTSQFTGALRGLANREWIRNPAGGNFSIIHASVENVGNVSDSTNGTLTISTVYVYITPEAKVVFHNLPGLEAISFLRGMPVIIYVINPTTAEMKEYRIGPRQRDGFVVVVPRQHYIVTKMKHPWGYSLLSSVVIREHVFAHVNIPSRRFLVTRFPQHSKIIIANTNPDIGEAG